MCRVYYWIVCVYSLWSELDVEVEDMMVSFIFAGLVSERLGGMIHGQLPFLGQPGAGPAVSQLLFCPLFTIKWPR